LKLAEGWIQQEKEEQALIAMHITQALIDILHSICIVQVVLGVIIELNG